PESTSLGGLASGGHEPGDHALFLNDEVHREGGVVLAMTGNIRVDTIVAQGCRPVGEPMRVTSCHGNFVVELDARKPAEVLRAVYESSSEVDRHLIQTSLFLGIALDEEAPGTGDEGFLIRNVLGLDPEEGVLAVGAQLTRHQRVQFHVRDQKTSRQDLGSLLSALSHEETEEAGPCGALLFSCLGRGARLYGEPGHDSRLFLEHLGPIPLGGFFCNGEIGPVQGRPFVHGYTSVFGLFRPRS
ncbi:MAG: FIST C-terminal domain-containing protein, partial [Myxococcota bacterium]|nr:FIST C-terminal domain-containing protein [Myxococcota bacterium]